MKNKNKLTAWNRQAIKNSGFPTAAVARSFIGSDHSDLGKYTIAQCEKHDRRVMRLISRASA